MATNSPDIKDTAGVIRRTLERSFYLWHDQQVTTLHTVYPVFFNDPDCSDFGKRDVESQFTAQQCLMNIRGH